MAILKCKMCGGDLKFEEGVTVVDCEYCGTKQTVPTIDDEKKITLFSRANRLRFACEFDKASGIYESIVADFPEEAEAYWGLVLCKYGIEYVDDPATGKKIPTCHRSSFKNVMEDNNFEQVLENADPIARSVYREEAKQIEELRRSIIEVSNKEEPYDIFICYKETAENGERTIDSVIAQDVYRELTEKGYRVFFSRITLEDKLGQEYEPYIFAALNSAKIMLAFGTDYEYYNAVWVKNEWSRFLQLIAKGEKKTLIPCYKNIDAYDMPKEFAKLQAQDMGKVGAMQDLLRGIEKLLPKRKETQEQSGKEPVIVQQTMQSATVDSLLKRVFMYLEDGDWSNAAEYCNRVLDISPENAEAYVGLLMAELRVKKEDELARQTKSFGQDKHFIKAVRFSGEERRKILEGYEKAVEKHLAELQEKKRRQQQEEEKCRLEEKRRQKLDQALAQMLELSEHSGESKNLPKFKACAAFWANPDNIKDNCLVDNREPRTIGDRYLYLAEHFQIADSSTMWWEFTFDCYRNALKFGADKGKCTLSRQDFYESLLTISEYTVQLAVLEEEYPEDWRIYWKYFKLCRKMPNSIPTYHQEVKSFLAKQFDFRQSSRDAEDEQRLVQLLETAIQEYNAFPQKQSEELQTYLNKAFTYAGNHLPALQNEWADYLRTLEEQCAKEAAQVTERLNLVQKKIADENKQRRELDMKYRHNAIMKGTICAVVALSLLMLTGCTIFYSWLINKKPEMLLPYSTFWYAIAMVVVCLIEMAVFTIIQNKLVKAERPEYPYKKFDRNLIKCSRPLTALAALAAAVLFVSGVDRFNANIGIISIGTPEEISYIKKHPGAAFIITQDIDLSDTEWKKVSNFSGTIDGQGHCLKGIVSKAPYLFSTNTGTIENITFAEIGISAARFSLTGQNNGMIGACEIRNVRLGKGEFWGFSKLNKGTVQNCVLAGIVGNTENFAGIAQKNEEDGIIKDCMVSELKMRVSQSFVGIVTDNKGTISNIEISDCTVSGCAEIAGICRDNNNTVMSCHVERLTAEDVTLSLGGGLIANSKGDVKDCSIIGLELFGKITGTIGGLIANSNGNIKDCTIVGMKLSVEADGVIGGLMASSQGSVENCSVTGLELSGKINGTMGGLIANSSGNVKDCTVVGMNLFVETGSMIGGLMASSQGSVENCSVTGLELSGKITGTMGGLIANSSGNVKDCTVVGSKLSMEVDGVIGGLIANSQGSVENCSVTGLELSGEIDGVMGGLIGQAGSNVICCNVEGIISLEGRSKIAEQAAPWLICGGLAGEQIRGNVEASSAAVQIKVDYYNPCYRGIFAGGIMGGIAGNCSISKSCFNGSIDITVTEETKQGSSNKTSDIYIGTEDFMVGGLFATYRRGESEVTVENAYSSGSISVQVLKEVTTYAPYAYIEIGGFTASSEGRMDIRNSYADLQITSSLPPENLDALHKFISNKVGGFTPNSAIGGATMVSAANCFFNGKLQYERIIGNPDNCGMWGKGSNNHVTNCYYNDSCGYGDKGIAKSSFRSASFLRDTLGWSDEIWNLEDGSLPTLKL